MRSNMPGLVVPGALYFCGSFAFIQRPRIESGIVRGILNLVRTDITLVTWLWSDSKMHSTL